jgi:hypothetical protein
LAALPGPASSEPSSLFPPPTNTRNPLDREFLLGTETGALLAARLDARAAPKKDAPPAALHAFADRRRAVYEQWWFWTGLGVVLAGAAVALGVALRPTEPPLTGTLGVNVEALRFP